MEAAKRAWLQQKRAEDDEDGTEKNFMNRVAIVKRSAGVLPWEAAAGDRIDPGAYIELRWHRRREKCVLVTLEPIGLLPGRC